MENNMPEIILAGCVIIQDNKILLIHRKETDWYEIPGGKVEQGELIEETAKRELKEELSCDVQITNKLGTDDFLYKGRKHTYTWFLANIPDTQTPRIPHNEKQKHDHYKFIPLDDLEEYKLSPNVKKFLSRI